MTVPTGMTALTHNYNTLKHAFRWSDKRVIYLMAKTFIGHEAQLDEQLLKNTRQELSQQAGVFSQLNGLVRDMIAALLVADQKTTEKDVALLISSYQEMKKIGYKSSSFTYFAAYLLQLSPQSEKSSLMARALDIIDEMRRSHPWITGVEDYPLAVSLATSDELAGYSGEQLAEMVEFYFQAYREIGFTNRDSIQFLACSTLLLVGGQNPYFVEQVAEAERDFRETGIKLRPLHYNGLMMLTYLKLEGVLEDFTELATYNEAAKIEIKMMFDRDFRETMAISLFIEAQAKELNSDVTNSLTINLNQLIIQEQVMAAATMAAMITASNSSTN